MEARRDDLRCAIETVLDNQHSVLWGEAYDLHDVARRDQCIEMLTSLVTEVNGRVANPPRVSPKLSNDWTRVDL